MNREIKFRAKHTQTGEWLYGSLYPDKRLSSQIDLATFWMYVATKVLDPETIGQYTSLPDKQGKDIYEGDIVRLGAYNNCQKKWPPTYKCVRFTLEHGGYAVSTPYTDNLFNDFEAKYCEVIGNIYENKELLE